MRFLGLGEFGLFAAEPAFGFGDLHAFAGAGPNEVGLEFGDHGQDVEEEPADGVGGVVDVPADAELDLPFSEVFDDVPGIRQRSGEPVEFGDDEGVAGSAGGEGFAESWSFAVGAGESVVDVDPVFGHIQRREAVALGGEVLFVGGYACVSDDVSGHGVHCSGWATFTGLFLGRGIRESAMPGFI